MIKIKRFDEIEFRAIQCGENGGYYPYGLDEADRAILLMKEGIYENNPKSNWSNTGWKFTEFGKEYYDKFMEKVQKKHGHMWMTNLETNPEFWNSDEYGNKIDIFAYESGFHNGPKCKNCGFEFCHHCLNEMEIPVCSKRK